ncbi:winged helix-turn-helix transcriptional regulator [Nonomuraea jabiensis]|uniref:winged helix-turn-helix transcriptional regulator n=1 Tax=Nonomuraea jabiensis TaxID=882448 RepID=UPI00342EBB06
MIGGKWSAQVLVELGNGPRRFTQPERAITGISRRILTVSLLISNATGSSPETYASPWKHSRNGPVSRLAGSGI